MTMARSVPVLLAALVLAGCAKPPWRLAEARALFADADLALEERWAPHEFAAAREALRAAEREIEIQEGRFSWMRDNTKASVLLRLAEQDLSRARDSAAHARRSAEIRSREAMNRAVAALRDARVLLMIAPGRSGRRGDGGKSQLAAAEARIEEAVELVAAGRYDEAERFLDGVHASIAALHSGRSGRDTGIY